MSVIRVKVSFVGDIQIGKTSLIVNYVEDKFDNGYIQTLGLDFMEKKVVINEKETICFNIFDLGGSEEFANMLPVVCSGADVVCYLFDLTNKKSLVDIKNWHKQVKPLLDKKALIFIVGTKLDLFVDMKEDFREDVETVSKKIASILKCPLVYCSAKESFNVGTLFNVILMKLLGMDEKIKKMSEKNQFMFNY